MCSFCYFVYFAGYCRSFFLLFVSKKFCSAVSSVRCHFVCCSLSRSPFLLLLFFLVFHPFCVTPLTVLHFCPFYFLFHFLLLSYSAFPCSTTFSFIFPSYFSFEFCFVLFHFILSYSLRFSLFWYSFYSLLCTVFLLLCSGFSLYCFTLYCDPLSVLFLRSVLFSLTHFAVLISVRFCSFSCTVLLSCAACSTPHSGFLCCVFFFCFILCCVLSESSCSLFYSSSAGTFCSVLFFSVLYFICCVI